MSLRLLARLLGISAPYLSDIEQGNRKLSFRMLMEICCELKLKDYENLSLKLSQELDEIDPAVIRLLIAKGDGQEIYSTLLHWCYKKEIIEY